MPRAMTFAQLGALYNATTNELMGGVSPQNQHVVLQQLSTIQQGLNTLANNGTFTDGATITHVQNMSDQINFLTNNISLFGTDAFQPKFINDVQRDIQDIAQGDANLAGLTAQNHGFMQTSHLLTPPAPFTDNAAQNAFAVQFGTDSNSLATKAQAAVGMDPNSATVTQLIADLHTFATNADAFSTQQGGLYTARFANEIAKHGVADTAVNEIITGLQKGDVNLVKGASDVLTANATDFQGNNQFNGIDIGTGTPVVTVKNGGIPASIPDVATAGAVFNDASTKLIGGVYAGNQASIVADLNATATGLQNAIGNQHLTGQALVNANTAIKILGQEAGLVGGINTANPTPVSQVNHQIGLDQTAILNTINHDPTLAGLTNGGFAPNAPVGIDHGALAHANMWLHHV